MNCLPTSKILSGKSKNKYLLSATQKYEQRIKEVKKKPDFPIVSKKIPKEECEDDRPCLNEWIVKRREIDKWRKSVLFALQVDPTESTSSSVITDSLTQPESSTLTTSNTLCSAGEAHKHKMVNDVKINSKPKPGSNFYKVPKSPSIPLYHSNLKGPPEANNTTFLYDYYKQQNQDSTMSIVDDDEVFVPSCSPQCNSGFPGQSSGAGSSYPFSFKRFPEVASNSIRMNDSNVNRKYTPQPMKRPLYLPGINNTMSPENKFERMPAQKYTYQNSKPEQRILNHDNSMSSQVPSYPINAFVPNQDIISPSPKKTLHKNETNAKIILRLSISSPSNETKGRIPLQRTRSLNVKRSPQNAEQMSPKPRPTRNNYDNLDDNISNDVYFYSSMKAQCPNNIDNNGNGAVKSHPNQSKDSTRFLVMKPTFSQENICYPSSQNFPPNYPLLKISSYNNLRTVNNNHNIPKVPLNEPLTLKFAFGSEPTLLRNF